MESHEVLRRAFQKTSPKAVASELGISLSLVYKWAEKQSDDGSGSRNPLDRLLKVIELSGDEGIIEWLCQQNGGYFVSNPNARLAKKGILPATHVIIGQFSDLLSRISDAAEDHSISPKEAKDIREVWDKLKSYTESFVRCCEEGDFDEMKKIPAPPQGPARFK
jgi:hypothetical protein